MKNIRISALVILLVAAFGGYFLYSTEIGGSYFSKLPFKLGLDLAGGTHLVYQADTSKVAPAEVADAMTSLRETIDNRINVFGVSEPLVQTEQNRIGGVTVQKLIVELPGVTETDKAIEIIGATPTLEFKLLKPNASSTIATASSTGATLTEEDLFEDTGLTGRLLSHATLSFNPTTGAASISIEFNEEGTKLFAAITEANVGKPLAILLDGQALSVPSINEPIRNGKAEINGDFTPQEAKKLVRDLNYGALPLPITLLSTQTIGASLGAGALNASVFAGIISFIAIAIFLLLWYRLPGLVAVIALAIYTILNLAIFKLIPVTLTSAGLAGFILSIGMAVDANILIFERMKEELRKGLSLEDAIREGFHRAWLSIRDSNLSSIITGAILYYFATSSLIKGFAFVFVIGVLTSMFTAITVSRTLLLAIGIKKAGGISKFLFGSGVKNK
ncbi:MAG: protein translocase subunit SecD [Candidatus Paceibacterota bacterium]|jgi:protein-export membrane protein SecD